MKRLSLAIITLLACAGAQAAIEEKVTMNLVTSQGVGQAIGTVTIAETAKGLNRLEAIMIRTKPANTKARKAQVIWVTCRCWW